MAAAIIEHGHSLSVEPKPDGVEEFQNFPGEGIYGKIDGNDIHVGNRKIAMRAGCATVPILEGGATEGKSVGYIFLNSLPAGIFSLSDVCRTGVQETIKELKIMGIKTAMLTGDCHAAARHAQDQKIPKAVRLARRTCQKVIENLILSVTTKAAILALAIAGHPIVWAAVLANVGSCLLVILNSMLLLRGAPQYSKKCCKSSAVLHDHKHGSETDGGHCSHTKQHCSDIEAQKMYEPQSCSSKMCASRDHGKRDMFTEDIELGSVHNHACLGHSSCCGEDEDVIKVENHGGCVAGDMIHEAKHCEHKDHSMINHNMEMYSVHNHLDCSISSEELDPDLPTNKHCHKNICMKNCLENRISDESLSNMVKSCSKNCPPNGEDHSECKKHATEGGKLRKNLCSTTNHVECTTVKACMSLENRRFGACCESFRKGCCDKNGHFGASFKGGLSEIIIE
ncbi:unnamed protein product [Ilex paraguariensis]|uniref:Uncharacterized protein n=1 Tax=Ilex paraguariensis TaxID=185542 RepID=A0ABC8SXZ6_9AQUA